MGDPSYFSPIVLFVYNRPIHTRLTLEALSRNPEAIYSDLHIYSDGPVDLNSVIDVTKVRRVIREFCGFKSISIVEQDMNIGLAQSIIGGVTELFKRYSTLIVLEDDLVVSRYFLEYMNSGLKIYKDEQRVGSIHGFTYPIQHTLPETFFLRGGDCWGWATWDRAWKKNCLDGSFLVEKMRRKNLIKSFNLDGAYPFYKMLKNQVDGKNDSWAIRWHASLFLENMLTLYPGKSLVSNIGHDGSGIHSAKTSHLDVKLCDERVVVNKIPICEDQYSRAWFKQFLWRHHSSPLAIIKRIFRKCCTVF